MSENYNEFNENENTTNENYNSCSYVSENNPEPPKKKKKHTGLKAIALILCVAIVGGGSVQVYKYVNDDRFNVSEYDEDDDSSDSSESQDDTDSSSDSSDDDEEDLPSLIELASRTDSMSVPDIVDAVMPSVVGVSSTFEYTSQSYSSGWGWGYDSGQSTQTEELVGTGPGIILTED
ncbi:MAG: hypothetical protein LIO40_02960, partial [Ruminococcus sp.]|nr:hypothetical protein [Ruminococcus sp.]